jgi:Protein of unknown function (DUF4242)
VSQAGVGSALELADQSWQRSGTNLQRRARRVAPNVCGDQQFRCDSYGNTFDADLIFRRSHDWVTRLSSRSLCGASRASNQAIEKIGKGIQWQHSYVAADKTFCIYLAESEEAIRKHGELSGIPVTKITEIPQIIDPLTANN